MKIIQNTLKIQKKISNVSKKFWVGPKKVESVGFPETRHFFFWPYKCQKKNYSPTKITVCIHPRTIWKIGRHAKYVIFL